MAISTDDVRHFLLDLPELNTLNDFAETFTDEHINRSLNWSIENYNSEPPLNIRIATLADIPSNQLILMGSVIYLLRSLILNYQRNQLDYNDGGISISDKSQHQYLSGFLGQYVPEYKDLLTRTKQFININGAYGSADSQWAALSSEFDFRTNVSGDS